MRPALLLLRVAVSPLSTFLAIVFCTLWVRSHATFDRVSLPVRGLTLHPQTHVLISYRGSVSAVVVEMAISDVWHDSGPSHLAADSCPDQFSPRECVVGFGWFHNDLYLNVPNRPPPPASHRVGYGLTGRSFAQRTSGMVLPDWFVVPMLASVAILPWRRPRFSVRTLLFVMTLAAILLGIFSMAIRAPRAEWRPGQIVSY